ncbi:MAG: alpha/beta hydrolase [Candidatus Eremiobacteraeota bacterium]|nr:alpha/beta hydrolase [Candidatus Eremiobacteraeota bacterium]
MPSTDSTTTKLPTSSGSSLFVRTWDAETPARAVVVIAHGVSEHGERYDRIARTFSKAGYRTYASDHRGHGKTATGALGDAGANGCSGILDDERALIEHAAAENRGVPLFFLGHSMGSIVAQRIIASHGDKLAGAILSGTVGKIGDPGLVTLANEAAKGEPNAPSALFGGMFASFNAPFEGTTATGFEWLSRDEAEVRKYVDDPMSGNPLTNATLADFLPGWMEASSDETRAAVPKSLPILIVSGDQDPAGGNGAGPEELATAYRALGITDVTLKLYPQARHEVFNETNRDEVEADVTDWIGRHVEARLDRMDRRFERLETP